MDRRRFSILAGKVLGLGIINTSSVQGFGSSVPDSDTYAIWSLLIPTLRPRAEGYLVADLTVAPEMNLALRSELPLTPIERAMRGGLLIEMDVPEEMQGRFAEALSEVKAKAGQVVRVGRRFTLAHPYRLLDAAGLDAYRRLTPPACVVDPSHPWHRDRALERRFAGFSAPCRLSRVSFDQGRTLGLVLAGAADGGTAYAFGKEASGWRRLEWRSTSVSVNC